MIAAKLNYLRIKLNEGKPVGLHDVNLLIDAIEHIQKLEKKAAMYEGEIELLSGRLMQWNLVKIEDNNET